MGEEGPLMSTSDLADGIERAMGPKPKQDSTYHLTLFLLSSRLSIISPISLPLNA